MSSVLDEIRNQDSEMDLTPMIDVVFLLLVFFMIAAKFRTQEGQIQSYLPKNRGMASAQKTEVTETRIFVSWRRPGNTSQFSRDAKRGTPYLEVGDPTAGFHAMQRGGLPDYPSLGRYLQQAKVSMAGRNKGEGIKVIIDGQPLVPWKYIIQALDVVVGLEIKDVTFAAKEEPY